MTEADKANEGREEKTPSSIIDILHSHSINTEFVAAADKWFATSAPLSYYEAAFNMYAHNQLKELRDQLSKEREKVKSLERWKKEEMEVWGPVLDYMQDGGSGKRGPIGSSISELVLQILKHHYEGKEREMIKELVDALTFSSKIIDSLIAKATELDKK